MVRAHWNGMVIAESDDTVVIDRNVSIPTVIVLGRFGHEIDRQVGVPSRRRLDQMIRHGEAMVAGAGERGVA